MNRTIRVKWSIKDCYVLSLDRRLRDGYSGEQEEYAVVKVGTLSDFDDITERSTPGRVKVKFITLMCFDARIFSRLTPGEDYSFSGKVGFGYGSTYFTIEKVFLFGEDMTTLAQEEVEGGEGDSPPSPLEQATVENMLNNLGYSLIRFG